MINLIKRNLEQQVLKNQDDIEALKMLGMPGVKVTEVVDSIEDISEPILNAFYLVKNEQNTYDLYIYTTDEEFLNLGEFPKSGPQGNQGAPGPQGLQGESTRWYSGVRFPSVNLKNGDMFLDTSSYEVYIYNGSEWVAQTNIKGAAGNDGQNGNSITAIRHVHAGNRTTVRIETSKGGATNFYIPDGEPGAGFHVAETLTLAEPLPADIVDYLAQYYPVDQYDYSEAILIKCIYTDLLTSETVQRSYIFVLVDDDGDKVWDNAGQIESVQGPPGEPGTQVQSGEQTSLVEVTSGVYEVDINAIPYLDTAPTANYTPTQDLFKVVILPKSVESTTTKYSGYIYFFYEE